MTTTITRERADTPDAIDWIGELEALLQRLYPSKSRHGYSVEKLLAKGVAFFVLRSDETSAACVGVELVDAEHGDRTVRIDGLSANSALRDLYSRPA